MHQTASPQVMAAGAGLGRERRTRWFQAAVVLSFSLSALASCAQRSDCDKACRRVAMCKRETQHGKLVLGEKAPPADPDCMHKCETQPDAFAKCEGSKRTCAAMRDCHGSYRE